MREKLIELLDKIDVYDDWFDNGYIAEQLIANGVTIPVRCKDCKHWHEETGWCYHHSHFLDSEIGFCHPWESNDWKMFDDDYFCKDGERRTDDST